MTALREINNAINLVKAQRALEPIPKRKTLVVRVGVSAKRAIEAETKDKQLPGLIGGVRVVLTSAYRGWEIEEA